MRIERGPFETLNLGGRSMLVTQTREKCLTLGLTQSVDAVGTEITITLLPDDIRKLVKMLLASLETIEKQPDTPQ